MTGRPYSIAEIEVACRALEVLWNVIKVANPNAVEEGNPLAEASANAALIVAAGLADIRAAHEAPPAPSAPGPTCPKCHRALVSIGGGAGVCPAGHALGKAGT